MIDFELFDQVVPVVFVVEDAVVAILPRVYFDPFHVIVKRKIHCKENLGEFRRK